MCRIFFGGRDKRGGGRLQGGFWQTCGKGVYRTPMSTYKHTCSLTHVQQCLEDPCSLVANPKIEENEWRRATSNSVSSAHPQGSYRCRGQRGNPHLRPALGAASFLPCHTLVLGVTQPGASSGQDRTYLTQSPPE